MIPQTWKASIERLLRLRPRQLALELAYQVNREFVEALLEAAVTKHAAASSRQAAEDAYRIAVITNWLRGNAEGTRQFANKDSE